MDRLIIRPEGFRQIAKPSKRRMEEMAIESTTLAEQGAVIITQLLIERSTMDKLVDDLIAGVEGSAAAIIAARIERLAAPGPEPEVSEG